MRVWVLTLAVLVLLMTPVFVIAYMLDRRRKKRGLIGSDLGPRSPMDKSLTWVLGALLALLVFSLVGYVALGWVELAWIGIVCLSLMVFARHIVTFARLLRR